MAVETKPRKESSRSKRGLILNAAVEQFGEVGYEHAKWASIAGQVGIGQTALYHYFESKAHCLLTIMRLELTASLERFDEATSDVEDCQEALRAAIGKNLRGEPIETLRRRILQNHMDVLATPRQSEKEEEERLLARKLVGEIEREWAGLIATGIDSGVFRVDVDALVCSRLVLGMVVSIWRWYRPDGPLDIEDVITSVSDAAVRLVDGRAA